MINSVEFSPLTDWVVRGKGETIQKRSSSSLSLQANSRILNLEVNIFHFNKSVTLLSTFSKKSQSHFYLHSEIYHSHTLIWIHKGTTLTLLSASRKKSQSHFYLHPERNHSHTSVYIHKHITVTLLCASTNKLQSHFCLHLQIYHSHTCICILSRTTKLGNYRENHYSPVCIVMQ